MHAHVRPALLLPLLATLLVAPPARAGDPLSAAFRGQAKAAGKDVAAQAAASVKAVKLALADAAADYAAGDAPLAQAVGDAVDAVSEQRDLLEDAAYVALSGLAAQGVTLLDGFAGELPPADFRAGAGGAWDDAVTAIDATLDKADARLAAECAKFVKALRKGAAKQDVAVDVRLVLPAHGSGFRGVASPQVPTSLVGDSEVLEAPQVLIAARILETSQTQQLELGFRYEGAFVDVTLATTDADATLAGSPSPGPEGWASASFDLGVVSELAGWLRIDLGAGAEPGATAFVSAPNLAAADPGLAPVVADFKQDLAAARKDFGADGGAALKQLRFQLGSHLKALKSGQASAELALRTGFGNLADAREALGDAFRGALGEAVSAVAAALTGSGFTNADLTADLAPDAPGVYGDAAGKLESRAARLQSQAGSAFTGFVAKVLKLAAKQGEAVGAAVVAGNTGPIHPPLLNSLLNPPAELQSPVLLTDALVLVVKPALTEDFDLNLIVQADPVAQDTVAATGVSIPEGTPLDLDDHATQDGGTAKGTGIPLLGELPVLGWIFRAGADESDQRSLLVVIKPTLVAGSDEP